MEFRWLDETSEVITLHLEWTLPRLVGMQRSVFRQNLKDKPTNQLCVKIEARKNGMENRTWTFIPKRFILTRLAWDRLAWKKRSSLAGMYLWRHKKSKRKFFFRKQTVHKHMSWSLELPSSGLSFFHKGKAGRMHNTIYVRWVFQRALKMKV